jgi:LmbE family N-acetylglucosaminyl deacetylase
MISRGRRRWLFRLDVVLLLVGLLALGRYLLLSTRHATGAEADPFANTTLQPGGKTLIFAPHEDDETLGCAGYLQQAVAMRAPVRVVLMTNGEYPELDVIVFEHTLVPTPQKFIALGYRRQQETRAAMHFLGVPDNALTFFGYPNQYLSAMWLPEHWLPSAPVRSVRTHATRSPYTNAFTPNTVYCGQAMLEDVEKILLREKPETIITLHPNDLHVDHWPTYTVVRYALEELAARGESFAAHARVVTYLIHRDRWPVPRAYQPKSPLEPPAPLVEAGQTTWITLPLTPAQTLAKHQAITLYRTQEGSFDPLLRAFARANELYGIVPVYRWSTDETVGAMEVIRDPDNDLARLAKIPGADLTAVTLARASGKLTATLAVRGPIRADVTYHLSIHAGSGSAGSRIIAAYDWNAQDVAGAMVRRCVLAAIDPRTLATTRTHFTTTLTTPWPLEASTRFFLVRAWTTRAATTLDGTATETFRVD